MYNQTALVEDVALIGPAAKIRDTLAVWDETVVTTLLVQSTPFDARTWPACARSRRCSGDRLTLGP